MCLRRRLRQAGRCNCLGIPCCCGIVTRGRSDATPQHFGTQAGPVRCSECRSRHGQESLTKRFWKGTEFQNSGQHCKKTYQRVPSRTVCFLAERAGEETEARPLGELLSEPFRPHCRRPDWAESPSSSAIFTQTAVCSHVASWVLSTLTMMMGS